MLAVFCTCYFDFKCFDVLLFLDSSAVEHSAVNRRVVGSNPTRGAYGAVAKRLRHGTATP